jgi:hypothetical protein
MNITTDVLEGMMKMPIAYCFFFLFNRCYNPWWVLACFTISFHSLPSLHFSLQFLTFVFFNPLPLGQSISVLDFLLVLVNMDSLLLDTTFSYTSAPFIPSGWLCIVHSDCDKQYNKMLGKKTPSNSF